MKLLDGNEIAGFIQERHLKEVRSIKQTLGVNPKLVIISSGDNPANQSYMKLKQKYGEEIGVEVEILNLEQEEISDKLELIAKDKLVHGVIVQLPLKDESQTEQILTKIPPTKDIDGLTHNTKFEPATAKAILWLLSAYNVELNNNNIVIVGRGRLVGNPLEILLLNSGLTPVMLDIDSPDLAETALTADILITATGSPSLIKSEMLKQDAVVVDVGYSVVDGKPHGDLDDKVYDRQDLTITPKVGGVGPLTVAALFDNLLIACRN